MKKLILLGLLALSLNANAQVKHNRFKSNYAQDNTGLAITASGVVLGTISIFVRDGGEYTYSNGYNSTKIYKPFIECTNRVAMLGVSITISIGGLIYQHSNK